MCIFFLPSNCPFVHGVPKNPSVRARAVSHMSKILVNPMYTTIGRCVCPTSDTAFFCDNPLLGIQIRHVSSVEDPAGGLDNCDACTEMAREWQKTMFVGLGGKAKFNAAEGNKDQAREEWRILAMKMDERERGQVVQKTDCLCDKARKQGRSHVSGDRYCGLLADDAPAAPK